MGTFILIASMIIWALGYFPMGKHIDDAFDAKIAAIQNTNSETVLLHQFENQADSLILALENERLSKKQEYSLLGRIGKFIEPAISPLGFDWKMGVSLLAGSAAKEIIISTMGVIYQSGPYDEPSESLAQKLREQTYDSGPKAGQAVISPLVALSFMVFILIYFPCVAVFAAIRKESGQWRWPLFTSVYTTLLAWIAAFAVYQIGSLLGY
jgi:ferrous iron transport protein B